MVYYFIYYNIFYSIRTTTYRLRKDVRDVETGGSNPLTPTKSIQSPLTHLLSGLFYLIFTKQ